MWRVCRQLASQQPHIHSATFNQEKKVSRQTCQPASLPDLTRAKAGRPPTRTHANSHFMATPGHQSLLLPCIPGMPYRRHRTRAHCLRRARPYRTNFFSALSNGAAHWGSSHGPGPWAADRGSWHNRTMCRCHPTTGTHHPLCPLPFPPLSHQIPKVESTASHDHLNVSIRPEFRAEEAAVEHWYRAYWKAKRQCALGGHAQKPKVGPICPFSLRARVPYSTHIVTGQPVCMYVPTYVCMYVRRYVAWKRPSTSERAGEKRASAPVRRPRGPMSLSCGHAVAASDVRPLAGVCSQSRASRREPACQVMFDSHPPSSKLHTILIDARSQYQPNPQHLRPLRALPSQENRLTGMLCPTGG